MAKDKEKKAKKDKAAKKAAKAAAAVDTAAPKVAKAKLVAPLAPKGGFPALPRIEGVDFAAAAAGGRYQGRLDVLLARLAPGTTIAGAFTRSATRSAKVSSRFSRSAASSSAIASVILS